MIIPKYKMRGSDYLFKLEMWLLQDNICSATLLIEHATIAEAREFVLEQVRKLNQYLDLSSGMSHSVRLEYVLSFYEWYFGYKPHEITRGDFLDVNTVADLEALARQFDVSFEIDMTSLLN